MSTFLYVYTFPLTREERVSWFLRQKRHSRKDFFPLLSFSFLFSRFCDLILETSVQIILLFTFCVLYIYVPSFPVSFLFADECNIDVCKSEMFDEWDEELVMRKKEPRSISNREIESWTRFQSLDSLCQRNEERLDKKGTTSRTWKHHRLCCFITTGNEDTLFARLVVLITILIFIVMLVAVVVVENKFSRRSKIGVKNYTKNKNEEQVA